MRRTRPAAVLFGTLGLAACAAASFAWPARERTASRDFQRFVHGLGLGRAVDLSGGVGSYDARLAGPVLRAGDAAEASLLEDFLWMGAGP